MALKLFGVTLNDAHLTNMIVPDTETVVIRDLAAVCGTVEYREIDQDGAAASAHDLVVSVLAARGTVLPAPVGVVFRSRDSVQRWLELHYGALTDAMSFVENRVGARVHVFRRPVEDDRALAVEVSTVAEDAVRALKQCAVATLPLRADKTTGVLLSAAFLVERDKWSDLADEIDAQSKLAVGLQFDLSGPWPPYDFVQMQLKA